MKFRRKPVVRDVVDAVKAVDAYVFIGPDGKLMSVAHPDFERDYEPAKRDYVKKARVKKAKKATEQP